MSAIDSNPLLSRLLRHIIQNVIREKRTNGFLLEFGIRDSNIDSLFDRRMIHLRDRNVSSRDNPGIRYLHYKIDYGSYIDLIATTSMPDEVDFSQEDLESRVGGIAVPEDDARSFRRSILDLEEFYNSQSN